MKLNICEEFDALGSVELNTDLDSIKNYSEKELDSIEDDTKLEDSDKIYEDLEALGFVLMLASNDIHTIHINSCGSNFKELHESADYLYKLLADYADECLEICCEDGHFIHNINNAQDLLNWENHGDDCKSFKIESGTRAIIEILNDVIVTITELYNDVTSDIQSTLDEWKRKLKSQMNYFLKRVVEYPKQIGAKNESMMLRNTRHDGPIMAEHIDFLQLGKAYKEFAQVEDHIEDYDCDPLNLKKGDFVIRDFQFGHLPNGGNKGYIPYEVTDIIYDDISDKNGYYDRRTRIELDDGKEYFYIVCQNDRFNGILHKLWKDSVKK